MKTTNKKTTILTSTTIATILLMGFSLLPHSYAAIDSTLPNVVEIAPPVDVSKGALEHDTNIVIFQEKENYVLTVDVDVEITSDGLYECANPALSPAKLLIGDRVNSYYLHADKVGSSGFTNFTGSVTFDNDIIGVIIYDDKLDASDLELGAVGTTYNAADVNRGLDWLVNPCTNIDSFTLSGNTLTVNNFRVADAQDAIRVITEAKTSIDVAKFYDTNHNGIHDEGEEFLDGWLVNVNDTAFEYEYTNATYVLELDQNFTATELLPHDYTWINTTSTRIEFNSTDVDEIWFSNVCVGYSGEEPHTKGFWSNKNGQALCDEFASEVNGNLTLYPNFVNADNSKPPIANCIDVVHNKNEKPPVKNYLKEPTHGNINYTLSQQLLTMVFNNATESVNPEDDVYCHSIGEFFSLNSLMIEANKTLAEVGSYDAGNLAECLDDANNDMNYVQDEACPYDFGTDVTVEKVLTQNEIQKTELIPGESYNYTITVTNDGDYPAINANLYDVMGIGYQDLTPNPVDACWTGDSGIYSCDLGDLVDSVVLNIELFLEFDHSQLDYKNQAIVNGTNFDEQDVWLNATVIQE
jgi:hypothetical protein